MMGKLVITNVYESLKSLVVLKKNSRKHRWFQGIPAEWIRAQASCRSLVRMLSRVLDERWGATGQAAVDLWISLEVQIFYIYIYIHMYCQYVTFMSQDGCTCVCVYMYVYLWCNDMFLGIYALYIMRYIIISNQEFFCNLSGSDYDISTCS